MSVDKVNCVLQEAKPEAKPKQEKVDVEKPKEQKEKIPVKITGKITRLKVKDNKRYVQLDGIWKSLDQVVVHILLVDCLCRQSMLTPWSIYYLIHGEGILWTMELWI